MTGAWKVSQSTIAATRRGSEMTVPHSLNGRFEAVATEALSSRSVRIWNRNSDPRAPSYIAEFIETQKFETSVAGHDALHTTTATLTRSSFNGRHAAVYLSRVSSNWLVSSGVHHLIHHSVVSG
jgi:hypothetical protein